MACSRAINRSSRLARGSSPMRSHRLEHCSTTRLGQSLSSVAASCSASVVAQRNSASTTGTVIPSEFRSGTNERAGTRSTSRFRFRFEGRSSMMRSEAESAPPSFSVGGRRRSGPLRTTGSGAGTACLGGAASPACFGSGGGSRRGGPTRGGVLCPLAVGLWAPERSPSEAEDGIPSLLRADSPR